METVEKLLSPKDLSELLGVPVATLYAWVYRGTGPPSLHVGKHLRWRPSDVAKWLDKQ